jgi:hypothetical protein
MFQKYSVSDLEKIDSFNNDYYLKWFELTGTKKKYLGDKNLRRCRFCGRTDSTTKFRKRAHAFPQLIGNNVLISLCECDSCNERFANTIDNHLGNYFSLERTLSGIKGKGGIPKYKSPKKKFKIEATKSPLSVNPSINSDKVPGQGISYKTHTFSDFRHTYIPRLVYKSFIKMALSVMPAGEMIYFGETIKWLMADPQNDLIDADFFITISSFVPGVAPFRNITAVLGIRKDQVRSVPYSFFFICFSNYAFQLFVPLSSMDKQLEGTTFRMRRFPPPYEEISATGQIQVYVENWSSNEPRYMEPISVEIAYESVSVEDYHT